MIIFIILLGIMIGLVLDEIIIRISFEITNGKSLKIKQNKFKCIVTFFNEVHFSMFTFNIINILIVSLCVMTFIISFLKFGVDTLFFKAIVLDSILIVISFIDLKCNIIPNVIVIATIISGLLFVIVGGNSFFSTIVGMLIGGGIMFLLALVPHAIGGGDIKLMFALGAFLNAPKIILTLLLAFIFAALASIILLLFKIKGRKDHIPFGPFLSLGCFIVFHFLK